MSENAVGDVVVVLDALEIVVATANAWPLPPPWA